MKNEIWKDIPGYEGYYQVSNLGRVKSLERVMWMEVNKGYKTKKERLLKAGLDHNNYNLVILCKDKKNRTLRVHVIVAMAFLGHNPNGHKLVVNHKNFIRNDNRVENLEIITQRENANQKHRDSSSQYTGVIWDKSAKKWYSSIHINKEKVFLGRFIDEKEAALAYQNKLKEIS